MAYEHNIFSFYKRYLNIYPEWFIIKRYIEGTDITIIDKLGCVIMGDSET